MTKAEEIKKLQTELKRYEKKVGDQHKELSALKEDILGWKQTNKMTESIMALLLSVIGATEDKPLVVPRQRITDAMKEMRLRIILTEQGEYRLNYCIAKNGSEEKTE